MANVKWDDPAQFPVVVPASTDYLMGIDSGFTQNQKALVSNFVLSAALAAGVATWLAAPSSANLLSAMTTKTGTGNLVFATSPALTTPDLGTPSAGNLTNTTGFPASGLAGLGSGIPTWLATPTSANLAAAMTDETGTGALVFGTSPGFTTAANPVSSGGAALGTTALQWANLFLTSGGVINWSNGNVTLTHSSAALTLAGASNFTIPSNSLFTFSTRTKLASQADGALRISNNAVSASTFVNIPASSTLAVGNVASGTPAAQTLVIGESSISGTSSNIGGANGTIASGPGTGTGTASTLIFQTPALAASGTTGQTQTTRLTLGSTGVVVASGQALQLGNAAVTGLTAGVLAALTNATIVLTDSTGQAYRIPCII